MGERLAGSEQLTGAAAGVERWRAQVSVARFFARDGMSCYDEVAIGESWPVCSMRINGT